MTQDDWHRIDDGISRRRRPPGAGRSGDEPGPSLLSVALGHKTLLVLTGIFATLIAYAALTQVTPTYEADAQVLLEVQAAPVIDIPNAVPEAPDGIATLESAIILLRSPEIMRAVVRELDLTSRPEFNSRLREPSPVDKARDAVSDLVDKVKLSLGAEPTPPGSPRDPVESAARALRDKVSVRGIGESRVIEITAQSESATLAARISNAIARNYIDVQVRVKSDAGDRASSWLEERAQELRAQLEANEAKLSEFRREMIASGRAVSIDLDAQLTDLSAQMVQLNKQLADLEAQRAEIKQLRADGNYLTLAASVDLPTVTALVEQLAALDGTIVELNAVYGDHSKTREAQETRRQLISLLETETARLISGLEVRIEILGARLGELSEEIRETRSALVDSRQDDIRLAALTREVEASRNIYERFLLRQKEVRERSQFQSPGVRLVAEAERPSAPVAPQKAKLSVLAGIGAGGLMLLYLTLRQLGRSRAEEVEAETLDLDALTRMGTLVTIPRIPDLRTAPDILRHIREDPGSDLAVSVDWLKSCLKPRSLEWSNLILITSADRGDGKSTLALLLAESFSREHSTVLVNADADGWLSDFAQSEKFKTVGFSFVDYSDDVLRLVDEEFAIEDRLHDRRENLLGAEIVIVDAPAMPMSAGLLEIGQLADHTVVACAWDGSRLRRIKRCARTLEDMGIAISAFVLNMIPRDRQAALTRLPRATEPLRLAARGKS